MGREPMCDTVDRGQIAIEDYLDAAGNIALPDGTTLTSYLDRNTAELGNSAAYRYLDYVADSNGKAIELTWTQLGTRLSAVAARLQQITQPGDRVAILAPQGIDYVVGFFAAIKAKNIAVPLFAPELPGHTERLDAVLADAAPTVVLTTTATAEGITTLLRKLPRAERPRIIAVDAIPDSLGSMFVPAEIDTDDIAYLQYTSGSTRTPAGVEISHRAVCTNVLQMIMSVKLDTNIRSVSWLPLYHDMGLLMIMFPALCGGQITLMSPISFVRRPHRWISELAAESSHGRTFAAAPNFAFELAAQRGLPAPGVDLDLSKVAGLINGSEPVSIASVDLFNAAFGPYGLPPTTIKPSYGLAEATLFVSTIDAANRPTAVHLDRVELGAGRAVRVQPDHRNAAPHVSCGTVAVSQWAVITNSDNASELADGSVGEIWLHGDNVGRGYWGRPLETDIAFRNKLQSRLDEGSHADGAPLDGFWFRTGDLGVYLDGELYITGRIKDLVIVDGRNHYPQDIEATASEASPAVRSGFVAAFSITADDDATERLVVIAERAPGAGRAEQSEVTAAIRAAISRHHALPVADVVLVPAGSIPRTTSGKLARSACRNQYLTTGFNRPG